jgi:hypothetical protein
MPRTRDEGYWVASGARAYHPDKTRIKLAKVFDTGHVEFKLILEKVYEEIRTREQRDTQPLDNLQKPSRLPE